MIAMNDAVDVLRHGWQDAASIFAPESPEIAELLQARLEMAVASGSLDEAHLLGAVADLEELAARTGSSAGPALARRLRRTVYEYLLALDAAPFAPQLSLAEAAPAPAPASAGVTADEVDALGQRADPSADDSESAATAAAGDAVPAEALEPDALPAEDTEAGAVDPSAPTPPATGSRRRRHAGGEHQDGEAEAGEPTWAYVPRPGVGEEADTATAAEPAAGSADAAAAGEPTEVAAEATDDPAADSEAMPTAGAETASAGDPEAAATPEREADDDAGTGAAADEAFVAPRAGFHIVEDSHPSSVPGEDAALPLPMPAFATDEAPVTAAGPPAAPSTTPSDATGTVAPAPPAPPAPPAAPLEVDPENGWRVRGATVGAAELDGEDDPFEIPRYADLRHRIEDRLRRKRCDEAAALLQELAQETGGRVVAELAMNAGDRCQSLGKSNAALNCYLAASRADPVYELPLSRLADICIDDQETDLAVSYLERIARLYRHRGEDRAALRVYRRIATIAPYREDIFEILLTAQSTGRLES